MAYLKKQRKWKFTFIFLKHNTDAAEVNTVLSELIASR